MRGQACALLAALAAPALSYGASVTLLDTSNSNAATYIVPSLVPTFITLHMDITADAGEKVIGWTLALLLAICGRRWSVCSTSENPMPPVEKEEGRRLP